MTSQDALDLPRLPFIVGVTGKMVLDPGPYGSKKEALSWECHGPLWNAVQSRVFAVLDWLRAGPIDTRRSDWRAGSPWMLDPNSGAFHPQMKPGAASGPGSGSPTPRDWPCLGLEATPILVLTNLAPGFDSLVAEAALDYAARTGASIRVRAHLPFDLESYRRASTFVLKDDQDPAGAAAATRALLARFDGLVERIRAQPGFVEARDLFEVELESRWAGSGEADLEAKDPETGQLRRYLRYRAAGESVASACHLLLACLSVKEIDAYQFERAESPFVSGSSAILGVRQLGPTPGLLPHAHAFPWTYAGPTLLLPLDGTTPRRLGALAFLGQEPNAEGPKAERVGHGGHREIGAHPALGELLTTAQALEAFNSNPASDKEPAELSKMLKSTRDRQNPGPAPVQEVRAQFAPAEDMLRIRRRAADLASEFDRRRTALMQRLVWLVALAALLLNVYENWPWAAHGTHGPELHSAPGASAAPAVWHWTEQASKQLLLFGTLGCAFLMGLLYWRYRRSLAEVLRFDYRALAEGLRVQVFWSVSGLNAAAGSSYMQRQTGDLAWIRNAVGALGLPRELWKARWSELSLPARVGVLRQIQIAWAQEQLDFFRAGARKNEALHSAWHGWAWALAAAGLLNVIGKALVESWAWLHTAISQDPTAAALYGFGLLSALGILTYAVTDLIEVFAGPRIRSGHGSAGHGRSDDAQHRPAPSRAPGFLVWLLARPGLWRLALPLACFAFALAHGLGGLFPAERAPAIAHGTWIILTTALFLTGALCLAWSERRLYGENARRYAAMEHLWAEVDQRLTTLLATLARSPSPTMAEHTLAEIHQLLKQAGSEALDENSEWLILNRTRPLEPFMPG
jgi:hypothetical protein